MNARSAIACVVLGVPVVVGVASLGSSFAQLKSGPVVSYAKEIAPVIGKYCLPCHAEESRNSSELHMDTYALMMEGGKHGKPVVPGKPDESILVQKLLPEPPFGDTMPIQKRRRKAGEEAKKVTPEEIKRITTWIEQGAKNN